jgi:hypothetical protein
MASFPDFLSMFDPDASKRGKQFEHFVKWFLKNDPEWDGQEPKDLGCSGKMLSPKLRNNQS